MAKLEELIDVLTEVMNLDPENTKVYLQSPMK